MRTRPICSLAPKTYNKKSIILIFAALLSLTACTTGSPPPPGAESGSVAYTEGVPGGVVVNTVDMSAHVTAIDTANRKLTLLGPDGAKRTVKVGPEAINFDKIAVGDLVNVTLTEELVVYLDEDGLSGPDASTGMVALAPKGAKPGGVLANTTQVTATVSKIDMARRTATLKFDDGSSKRFAVRDDIDLSRRKVGEKVVFLVTDMIALSVDKP